MQNPMRIVKGQSPIITPGDETVVASIQITQTGKIIVQAPTIHPRDLIKMLQNLIIDLLYNSLGVAPASQSEIELPVPNTNIPNSTQ